MNIRALIFDMDGVIVNTEPLHWKAFRQVLEEERIRLSEEEYFEHYLALDDQRCFERALTLQGGVVGSAKVHELCTRKSRFFGDLLKARVVIYPGVVRFIKRAADLYVLGVASGSRRLEVNYILKKAGVRDYFSATVSSDDVHRGKPDPESFQKALALLNERRLQGSPEIQPTEALVIEDSRHGVHGAHAAGMKCLAVTNSYSREGLSHADGVIETFSGLDPKALPGLVR